MKVCRKCRAEFSGRFCVVCNRLRASKWSAANPDKMKARHAKWYAINKDKVIEQSARWAKDHPDKRKESRLKWSEKNPVKEKLAKIRWATANPERIKHLQNKWYVAHPELLRIYQQNRRARVIKNGGALSKGITAKLFILQKGKCACCGKPLGDNYHLDHIMPIALGGRNENWNMQLLRKSCNHQKSAKHPIRFMQERGYLI